MLKKISYLLLLSLVTVGIISAPLTSAFWGGLVIPPYSQVIDVKRLNDSIILTTNKAIEAAQMLQMYEKRLLANTGIVSEVKETENLVSELSAKEEHILNDLLGPLNRSLVVSNPYPTTAEVPNSVWKDYRDLTDADLLSSIARSKQKTLTRTAEENSYKDALELTKNSLSTDRQIANHISHVGIMAADGILGQKQASVINQGLIVTMQNNSMAADSSMEAAESMMIKGEVLQSQNDERLAKTTELGSYDPYNRTAEDDRLSPADTPMGFPRF